MSYTHKEQVHVATVADWTHTKVFYSLKPLCGAKPRDNSVVLTISDLAVEVLTKDEYICPLCLEHEDYPLLLLANS
jgi:hypothetical protein